MNLPHQIPAVGIVILNWNGRHFLQQFLPSVIASSYPSLNIYVADNGSTDDSVDFLKKNFPGVVLIEMRHNTGFTGGYNEALKQVDDEILVLLKITTKKIFLNTQELQEDGLTALAIHLPEEEFLMKWKEISTSMIKRQRFSGHLELPCLSGERVFLKSADSIRIFSHTRRKLICAGGSNWQVIPSWHVLHRLFTM